MKKYYTRACNFVYGKLSVRLVNQKINLPLNGVKEISFNQIEIISIWSKEIWFLPFNGSVFFNLTKFLDLSP